MSAEEAGVAAVVRVLGYGLSEAGEFGVERAIVGGEFGFLRVASLLDGNRQKLCDILGQRRQADRPL